MPIPEPHIDLKKVDFENIVEDRESLRNYLPQRYEMEMLHRIVHLDPVRHVVVGYKDITFDEFWVRGHFPSHPVFPGVLMCEASAQLCGYYSLKLKLNEAVLIGLGGIDNAVFRRIVKPEERLVLVGKALKLSRRMTVFNVQGYVGGVLACHMDVKGVSLGRLEDLAK